jgi:hypothetical protein
MWLSKAAGFVGSIFGSSESTNKALDMVGSGMDMAFYTDEEKAIAEHKKLEFKLAWIKSTSGQNLARRVIAFAIVAIWCYTVMLAIHFYLLEMTAQADFLFKVLKDILNLPFTGIISFYFLVQFKRK